MDNPNSNFTNPFYYQNGQLFCEQVNLDHFLTALHNNAANAQKLTIDGKIITLDPAPPTPIFLYSLAAIKFNVAKYLDAIANSKLKCLLGYAVKANGNHTILSTLQKLGVKMLVCVSGNEVLAGLQAGFSAQNIILNGNGKQEWEIKLAIQLGTLLNVDSIFDAKKISNLRKTYFPSKEVRVLLRIRPSSSVHKGDSSIHPYVNTAEASKFGFGMEEELDQVLEILYQQDPEKIKVVGIHCHLGSCIYDPDVYRCIGQIMKNMVNALETRGHSVSILDIGGGIGIDYYKTLPGMEPYLDTNTITESHDVPNVSSFMEVISEILPNNVTIILEPGRSMIADTGIMLCNILGTKEVASSLKRFVVVDASMAEVIRPCLYNAHHQIFPTKLYKDEKWEKYNVVGPICETADFLGHDVPLQINSSSSYLAIMDVGAYCSSMSSNYNMRPRPAEILVDGSIWTIIRERDTFKDVIGKSIK